jgi:hypothetical protein
MSRRPEESVTKNSGRLGAELIHTRYYYYSAAATTAIAGTFHLVLTYNTLGITINNIGIFFLISGLPASANLKVG